VWRVGWVDFAKLCMGGGPGFDPHGLHNILNKQPITGCHVAAHDWATWHQTICQNNATCHNMIRPNLPINECHITNCHLSVHTDCHIIVRPLPRQHPVRTVQSAHFFFACLTIRTDRDISLIRRPFEPKRVALGS
jgi:hypothetical protein